MIDYDHSQNLHTLEGPKAALPIIFSVLRPSSILDVGCGAGTWLRAAMDLGVSDAFGVDGVDISPEKLYIPPQQRRVQDLTKPWDLGRRFEMAICLEVGEHLDEPDAPSLVEALVKHADTIVFSSACPSQPGQHHVNCQWPVYWQRLFNKHGYACEDSLRWKMWDESRIEPWYCQNIFCARRDPATAGQEARIRPVIHPGLWNLVTSHSPVFEDYLREIKAGNMPVEWHFMVPPQALWAKIKRKLKGPA
jgi:SAM-dependent methyltransferase